MKTIKQIREEFELVNELSSNLLKRYMKKARADGEKEYAKHRKISTDKGLNHQTHQTPHSARYNKRYDGTQRADQKVDGNYGPSNAPDAVKVRATKSPAAPERKPFAKNSTENKKAKEVAHSIASAHKNLKVSSHGDKHFIHHKHDTDGHEHIMVTPHPKHADKVHVSHEYGMTHGSNKSLSHAAAVKHGHSIVKGAN